MILRCFRRSTVSSGQPKSPRLRARTSTKQRISPSQATRSISPPPPRKLRSSMRNPLSWRNDSALRSREKPISWLGLGMRSKEHGPCRSILFDRRPFVRSVFGDVRFPDMLRAVPRGVLHLIAAPEESADLTLRALRILQDVHAVACEDSRAVKKLLAQLAIDSEVVGLEPHGDLEMSARLCDRMEAGESVALIAELALTESQAELMKQAIRRGIRILPAAPSQELAAVQLSALASEHVLILGSLPKTDAARREVLGPLRS